MDSNAYITKICRAVADQLEDSTLSKATKTATRNVVHYYLTFSEAESMPRWKFNSATLKRAFDFCTGPLPHSLSAPERAQLASAGQRDYQEALKLLPIVLNQAFAEKDKH